MKTQRELEIDEANRAVEGSQSIAPCEFCWMYHDTRNLAERPSGKMACEDCVEEFDAENESMPSSEVCSWEVCRWEEVLKILWMENPPNAKKTANAEINLRIWHELAKVAK
jgi:hypothetical protein